MVLSLLGVVTLFGAFPVEVPGATSTPVLVAGRFSLPGLAAAADSVPQQHLPSQHVPLPLTIELPRPDERRAPEVPGTVADAANTDHEPGTDDPVGVTASRPVERAPIYFEYEVQPGDTLSSIAGQFGVGVDYVRWNNLDIENPKMLAPGKVILVPTLEGIIHPVRYGESISEIAARYDADPRDIIDFRPNRLSDDPNNLRVDGYVLVPGGRIARDAPMPDQVPAPPTATDWIWPGTGRITSLFEPGHPLGIDVGMPVGTPLVAARTGIVSFVGGNPCCSYGYYVIVDHGDGYETVYAHLSRETPFNVTQGDSVEQGQIVGWSGNTGISTGPHVHFELRRKGVNQDPMLFLP